MNQPLFFLTQSFRKLSTDHFWVFLTLLASPKSLMLSSGLLATMLAIKKQWRTSLHLIALVFLVVIAIIAMKAFYFNPRPDGFSVIKASSSFPSGHTTFSVAFFGFLAFLTATQLSYYWRKLSNSLFILLIFLISLSRLFLGQHWLTDIVAAWFLGISILLMILMSYKRNMPHFNAPYFSKRAWFTIMITSLIIPWGINIYLNFQTLQNNTQPAWPTTTLTFQNWWKNPVKQVPLYRLDRFGNIIQPFNVQWAGSLDIIQQFLEMRGWQLLETNSRMTTTIQRFTSLTAERNMPLLPELYQNKPPALFLIYHVDNTPDILELRLWNSGVQFSNTNMPLWVGTITYHTPPEKLLRFPKHYIHLQSGYILVHMPPKIRAFQFQLAHIPSQQQPERIRELHWDGDLFIFKPISSSAPRER